MDTVLIDGAALGGPGWAALLQQAALPELDARLGLARSRVDEPERADADAAWLSPAERWLLSQLGLADADTAPWGALAARGRGLDPVAAGWALALPCQLTLGRDSLSLDDPQRLQLRRDEADALVQAVAPLLDEAGWRIDVGDPQLWLLGHPQLAGVRSADAARAIGRNVGSWMPAGVEARSWRRLLTELQMVWQHHPVNEARERDGRPPVNALWLHGAGVLPPKLDPPFALEGASADASAWWRAASSGWPVAASGADRLRRLQPAATRADDPATQLDALHQLDTAAAAAIDTALDADGRVRLVLAGARGWQQLELARSWRGWLPRRRGAAAARLGGL